jgi:phosphohistidine phosphatase
MSMLRLTLIRHAKTEPQHAGQEDWDRALERRGQHDAAEMGQRLKGRKLKPDKLLVSPAVRALATAQIMVREMGLPAERIVQNERLYLASAKETLKVVQESGGTARHLAVVGHNPGITEFADQVAADRAIDNMPTAAIFTLEFDIAEWSELGWKSGVNAEFDYPSNSSS